MELNESSRSRLNKKTVFPRYGDYHVKCKTVARPSYLSHGNSYTGKTTSLYWDGPLLPLAKRLVNVTPAKKTGYNSVLHFNVKTIFSDTRIPIFKIRLPWNRCIFEIGILIPKRQHIYIKKNTRPSQFSPSTPKQSSPILTWDDEFRLRCGLAGVVLDNGPVLTRIVQDGVRKGQGRGVLATHLGDVRLETGVCEWRVTMVPEHRRWCLWRFR